MYTDRAENLPVMKLGLIFSSLTPFSGECIRFLRRSKLNTKKLLTQVMYLKEQTKFTSKTPGCTDKRIKMNLRQERNQVFIYIITFLLRLRLRIQSFCRANILFEILQLDPEMTFQFRDDLNNIRPRV